MIKKKEKNMKEKKKKTSKDWEIWVIILPVLHKENTEENKGI